ncbi:MAG: F0F1 ATP synthase subunit gamma [Methylohalobius sp.]|nr:F0F1 ATP synthase subunit gamma [Methylohalobius sp.]
MHTLQALGRAIATSSKVQDIVRTMKVLSAASLRQCEQAAKAVAAYGRTVELGLVAVLREVRLPQTRAIHRVAPSRAAIAFGSDYGLCGRFNDVLANLAARHLQHAAQIRILAVGARMDAQLQAQGLRVEECFFAPGSVAGITVTVRQILERIESWRGEGVETLDLFYHRRDDQGKYQPAVQRLLPPVGLAKRAQQKWPGRSLPTFSLAAETLLAALFRQHLFISLFRACAESQAAEHSQRLVAMQLAEKNIAERLEGLTRSYGQLRQEQITSELLEVVAGFEAVEKDR